MKKRLPGGDSSSVILVNLQCDQCENIMKNGKEVKILLLLARLLSSGSGDAENLIQRIVKLIRSGLSHTENILYELYAHGRNLFCIHFNHSRNLELFPYKKL